MPPSRLLVLALVLVLVPQQVTPITTPKKVSTLQQMLDPRETDTELLTRVLQQPRRVEPSGELLVTGTRSRRDNPFVLHCRDWCGDAADDHEDPAPVQQGAADGDHGS